MKYLKGFLVGLLLFFLFYFSPAVIEAESDIEDFESDIFIDEEIEDLSIADDNENELEKEEESDFDEAEIATDEPETLEEPADDDSAESDGIEEEEIEDGYIEPGVVEPELNPEDEELESNQEDEAIESNKKAEEIELSSEDIESKIVEEDISQEVPETISKDETEEIAQASVVEINNDQSTFKKGDRHPTISEQKVKLNRVGFSGILVTDYFGDYFEGKVTEFQAYYGLSTNGIIDSAMIQKLDDVYKSPFQLGERHNDTKEIKRKLNQLGFGGITVTTLYGEYMESKVKEFQSAYGLKANGIVDEVTERTLNAAVSQTSFQIGDRHPNISNIKVQLNRVGFSGILVTDYYGDYTADRVRDFQSYYGLPATGRTDTATIQKLNEVYNSPFQLNGRHNGTSAIKEKLNSLGFGGITVTTFFGEYMERQVMAFQKSQGLIVNGIVDDVTENKLSELTSVTVFQKGERHSDISTFKVKLNRLGFSGILVTDYFGDYTEDRVKEFQSYFGIPVTGKIDAITTLKLDEAYNSPFQLNKRHNETREIKEKLNLLGYGRITVTNLYGSYMEEQVKSFQRDHHLKVNGIVDQVTHNQLNHIVDSRVVKIFLDPGHGGRDPGGQGYGLDEKDIVLDITLKMADILKNQYLYADIELSRETDKYVALEDRSKQANLWGADFYLSIHTNALNGEAHGFESFIFNGDVSQETINSQSIIHNYLARNLPVIDRGRKRANFNVLRNSSMSALLIEYMFIDRYEENQLLRSPSYRTQLAWLTAEAIAEAFGLERR